MSPARILVRSPTWVGDAVMATPALRALREGHPAAEIVLEGPPALGGLLRGIDSFDRFLPDARLGTVSRARALRADHFDWAVLLPDSPRAALAPFLARIPRRVGYARDPLRRALLTDALEPERRGGRRVAVPMVERYRRITRHLGCPDRSERLELAVDGAAAQRVERRLLGCGAERDTPLVVVSAGASFGPSKRWPTQHFAEACDLLARGSGLLPVLAPAPGEEPIAAEIQRESRERLVALVDPPLDLEELKALVQRAALVVCNDTGPRHVAVALDRPVVVLMGPTDPAHSARATPRERVLRENVPCSPCHLKECPIDHRCMTRIRPERVAAAALELLA